MSSNQPTPDGQSLWHKGMFLSIVVALPHSAGMLLPEAEQGVAASQSRASGDTQPLRALALLSCHGDRAP